MPDTTAHCTPRRPVLVSCRSADDLAKRLVQQWGVTPAGQDVGALRHLTAVDLRFPDGETCVRLEEDVSDADVYLLQALCHPGSGRSVDDNLMALLAALRACREWGAARLTAVLPYLAYARQDRPSPGRREPTTARLCADLLAAAGVDRVLTVQPHSTSVRGFFDVPVEIVSGSVLLAPACRGLAGRSDTVVVAPDAGAARLAREVGAALELPSAVAAKHRPGPNEVAVAGVMGDFEGKTRVLMVDDMVATGGTLERVAEVLVQERGITELHVGAVHYLGLDAAAERLDGLVARGLLQDLVVGNGVPLAPEFLARSYVSTADLCPALCRSLRSAEGRAGGKGYTVRRRG